MIFITITIKIFTIMILTTITIIIFTIITITIMSTAGEEGECGAHWKLWPHYCNNATARYNVTSFN